MLMTLALLAAIEAVPSPTVSLTLTGGADRTPVSAAPRSLSDVARELREGRKAVGGFSAAESTVSRSPDAFVPTFEPEPVTAAPEPEVVVPMPQEYAPSYLPVSYGRLPRNGRFHGRAAARFAVPRPMSPPPGRPSLSPAFGLRHPATGHLRQR